MVLFYIDKTVAVPLKEKKIPSIFEELVEENQVILTEAK